MLPVISENCPACYEEPKERHRVKQVLAQQEQLFPQLFHHLLNTMRPLMSEDLPRSIDPTIGTRKSLHSNLDEEIAAIETEIQSLRTQGAIPSSKLNALRQLKQQ